MAKDPAFLFYSNDFIEGTYTMKNEHVGMYIRLLCLQHQRGHLKELDMLFIRSTYVEEVFTKFQKDAKGLYYNERLEQEATKRLMYAESRRKNIQKRYSKKKKKKATYVVHMENENEDINIDIDNTKISKHYSSIKFVNTYKDFLNMRKKIKRKVTKQAEKLIFNKLNKYPLDVAISMLENSIEGSYQGVFELKKGGKDYGSGNKQDIERCKAYDGISETMDMQ